VRQGLALGMGEHPVIDIRLEVGAVSEAITVTADTPASFSLGGASSGTNELLYNGAPNAGFTNQIAYSPPQDAVMQVRVNAFESDASFGHTGGGTANQITKQGTNAIHGSLYEFLQNSARETSNPVNFATVPTPAERQGDFSALLKANMPGTDYTIYDPATGVVSGSRVARTPFSNNAIPTSRLNPVALKYLQYYPQPNTTSRIDGFRNYVVNVVDSNGYDNELSRVDLNLSDRNKLSADFRHSFRQSGTTALGQNNYLSTLGNGEFLTRKNQGASVDDVYTVSPSVVMDVRANWTRFAQTHAAPSDGFDPATLGFPSYIGANAQALILPTVTLTSTSVSAGSASSFQSLGNINNTDDRNIYDIFQLFGSVIKIHGNHTLKTGADVREYRWSAFNIRTFDTQFGNLRRDASKNIDMSMSKNFPFGERHYLQLRITRHATGRPPGMVNAGKMRMRMFRLRICVALACIQGAGAAAATINVVVRPELVRRHFAGVGFHAEMFLDSATKEYFDQVLAKRWRELMDEITGVYGGHHYANEFMPDNPDFYEWFKGKCAWAAGLAKAKGKDFILGEFGPGQYMQTRYGVRWDTARFYDTPQEPQGGLQLAEATLGAINGGIYAMGYWTFTDYPDPPEARGINHWGLFRWMTNGATTRAPYYAYGLLTKFFHGPAAVYQVQSENPLLRAAAVRNETSQAWSLAVVNRQKESVAVSITLPENPGKPFRKYIYETAHVPVTDDGDLQGPAGKVAVRGGGLSDTLPPESLVVYTTAYRDQPPAPVRGLEAIRGRDSKTLRWEPSTDPGVCYYRIYHDNIRIGSTTIHEFVDAGPTRNRPGDYTVVVVDQSGNASPPRGKAAR
jgi:hypothetical protein